MKKIIFVCSEFKIGGVETSFRNLISYAVDAKRYAIELHILNQNKPLPVELPENINIVTVDSYYSELFRLKTLKDSRKIIFTFGFFAWLKRLYVSFFQLIGKNKVTCLSKVLFPKAKYSVCDVCVVLKENDPCIYYALSKIKSNKRIVFFHTAKYFVKQYAHIYSSGKIDHIITVSQGNKRFLCNVMPKIKNKISVIHNVVVPEDIRRKAELENIHYEEDCDSIISVGRICNEKGIETILAAAAILKNRNAHLRWYLVGPFDKGMCLVKFLDILKSFDIMDYVIPVGSTSNPYPYIKAATILVNPSQVESFGMAIRESQILGVPVIATRTYGGNELVEDGVSGLLVGINNAKELAEKIILLMSDKTLYDKIKNYLGKSEFDESKTIEEQFEKVIS